jgi:2-polyprenyl-6-hydroxyphenyl methylase/3-demethylubiquinone-9 3-methyltransferase
LSSPTPFSTINYVEVSHFSWLSALWWDERDDLTLLHKMNTQRRIMAFLPQEAYRDEKPDADARVAS